MKSLLNFRFNLLIVVVLAVTLYAGNASCNQRHYWNEASQICERCHEKCLTCTGPFEANCTSCIENQRNFQEASKRCVCDGQGNFEDLVTQKCTSCSQMCASCNGPTNDDCFGCKHGSQLRINEFKTKSGTCVCGPSTYHVSNGYCETCDSSCKRCSGPTNQECRECKFKGEKMGLDGVCACPPGMLVLNNECKECPDYCSSCIRAASGQLECSKCLPGYDLDQNTKTCLCPAGYYSKTKLHTCLKCPQETCKRCNQTDTSHCLECYEGMTLTDGKCQCQTGTFDNVTNKCVAKLCQAGEVLKGDQCTQCVTQNCKKCGQNQDICEVCKDGYTLSYNLCVKECPDGFFKKYNARTDSNTCEICDSNCQTCSGKANFCTSCKDNFALAFGGTCNEKKECPPQKYYSTANERCMKCSRHCKEDGCTGPGYENCKTCPVSTGKTANGCELCHRLPGFYIENEVCTTKCGDGVQVGDEECDDGNTQSGDGCSSTCKVEPDFECIGRNPSKCYKKSEKKSFGYTAQLSNKKLSFKFTGPVGPDNIPINAYGTRNHKQSMLQDTTLKKTDSDNIDFEFPSDTTVVSFPQFSMLKHRSDDLKIDENCAAVPVFTMKEGEKRNCTSVYYPQKGNRRLLDEIEVDTTFGFDSQISEHKVEAKNFLERVSFIFAFTVFIVSVLLSFAGASQAFWSLIWLSQTLNLLSWLPLTNFPLLRTFLQAYNPLNFRFATNFVAGYLKTVLPTGFIYENDAESPQYQGFIIESLAVIAILILAKLFKQATNRGSLKQQGITTETRAFELGICSVTAFALIELSHSGAVLASLLNKTAAVISLIYVAGQIFRSYKENSLIKNKKILGFALGSEEEMKKKTSKRWDQCIERMIFAGIVGAFNGSATHALIGLFVLQFAAVVKHLIMAKTGNKLLSTQQFAHRISIMAIVGVVYIYQFGKPRIATELVLSLVIVANSLFAIFVMAYGNFRAPYQALAKSE